jgi:hypothetical protein
MAPLSMLEEPWVYSLKRLSPNDWRSEGDVAQGATDGNNLREPGVWEGQSNQRMQCISIQSSTVNSTIPTSHKLSPKIFRISLHFQSVAKSY